MSTRKSVVEEITPKAAWIESHNKEALESVFVPKFDGVVRIKKTLSAAFWGNQKLRSLANERFNQFAEWRVVNFNASLSRVLSTVSDSSEHEVTFTDDVKYSDVVGLRQKLDTLELKPFVVLSAFARVWTTDGKLLLFHRDSGDWSASYELSGGFVRGSNRHDTLQDFISERVGADIGLENEQIKQVIFLGWYQADSILESIGVFDILLQCNYNELQKSLPRHICLNRGYTKKDVANLLTTSPIHVPSCKVLEALASK